MAKQNSQTGAEQVDVVEDCRLAFDVLCWERKQGGAASLLLSADQQ